MRPPSPPPPRDLLCWRSKCTAKPYSEGYSGGRARRLQPLEPHPTTVHPHRPTRTPPHTTAHHRTTPTWSAALKRRDCCGGTSSGHAAVSVLTWTRWTILYMFGCWMCAGGEKLRGNHRGNHLHISVILELSAEPTSSPALQSFVALHINVTHRLHAQPCAPSLRPAHHPAHHPYSPRTIPKPGTFSTACAP